MIVDAPTNFASSYYVIQHALTAIPVDSLPGIVREEIAGALEAPLDTFEIIRIGKRNSESVNHSLAEYSNA